MQPEQMGSQVIGIYKGIRPCPVEIPVLESMSSKMHPPSYIYGVVQP